MKNINRGEIWLVNFNPTIGHEQSGIRPVLVISVNEFNNSPATKVVAIPLTSRNKDIPLDVSISSPEGGLTKESYIKCEDIRSLSRDRLITKLGEISSGKLKEVEYKLKLLLGF